MTYSVFWKASAEDMLIGFYVAALEKEDDELAESIAAVVPKLDQVLMDDPGSKGESRIEGERIFIESPVTITFQVNETELQVWVLTVKLHKKRRR